MTEYMLLLYANETAGAALPKTEMARWMEKMWEYRAALEKAGALISNGALGRTKDAMVVHVDHGQLKVHHGPYAETQDQLGGYFLIDVEGLGDAQQWAAKCPASSWGHVEIRQIIR
jgi:hypothetical protein